MAAEDWKGVAMVLQQLGQMAEPSKLDIMDREYELRNLEKQADREHDFLMKNFEAQQERYEQLQSDYKASLEEGQALDAELPGANKQLDFSGNAQKIMNDVYGNRYTNYQAGIETLMSEINKLENDIIKSESLNQAGKVGKKFTDTFTLGGKNYWDDAQIKRDEDGNPITNIIADKTGNLVLDNNEYRVANSNELADPNVNKYREQHELDELVNDMSYNESLYAIDQAALQYENEDERNAFTIVAKGQLDQEKEKRAAFRSWLHRT